jgi:hypothetical protein
VDRYGKGPIWRTNFWPILGDGIFSADFDNWLTQRKVRPRFSSLLSCHVLVYVCIPNTWRSNLYLGAWGRASTQRHRTTHHTPHDSKQTNKQTNKQTKQRAANMFKVANFKHAMLEAVRGKLQRFLGLLEETVVKGDDSSSLAAAPTTATATAGATAAVAAAPSAKKEEKGEDEEGEAMTVDGGKKGKGQMPSAVIEIQDLFFKLTLDTIGEIAFGRDLGSLGCVGGWVGG